MSLLRFSVRILLWFLNFNIFDFFGDAVGFPPAVSLIRIFR